MSTEQPPANEESIWKKLRRLACSLRSELCPACGGAKRRHESLCGSCYQSLPRAKQRALYKRIGEGYEEAIADAFDFLDVLDATDLFWPADPPTSKERVA